MDPRASVGVTRILKVPAAASNEDQELDFELDFLASLTTEQRFQLMFDRSREMAEMLRAHGHTEPPSIVKRT
jgi:hypothetical protein